jgi:hypothetical protein
MAKGERGRGQSGCKPAEQLASRVRRDDRALVFEEKLREPQWPHDGVGDDDRLQSAAAVAVYIL